MKLDVVMEPDPSCAPCLSRRGFLAFGVAGAATVAVVLTIPGIAGAVTAHVMPYPRKVIAKLADLALDEPRSFRYPFERPEYECFAVKLGAEAGGGAGPQKDIVAFSAVCTHQGGPLRGLYHAQHKLSGPCPIHLTTFDLRRCGMVVSGHATECLPQVMLEIDGPDVVATGVLGLFYGMPSNLPVLAGR